VKIAKSLVAGVVAVASLSLVAACGDQGDSKTSSGASATAPASAPAKSPSATEQLSAAAAKTGGTTYTFNMTSTDVTIDGSTDPAGPTTVAKIVVTVEKTKVTFQTLFSKGTYLVKVSGVPLPGLDGKKWLKIDPAKLKGDDALGASDVKDPTSLADLPGLLGSVTTTDGKQFKGTLDLSKGTFATVDSDTVKGLGEQAKAVPFEATVDDKGYLVAAKVSLPAYGTTKASDVNVAYTGIGAPVVTPTPAASEVIDAPAVAYQLLNGE
jgi:hypothetical protein